MVDGDPVVAPEHTAAASAAVTTHVGLADPHTQYQKESEKDQNNGYAGLDGSGLVPAARIHGDIARDTEVATAVTTHEGAIDPHTGYHREGQIIDVGVAAGSPNFRIVATSDVPSTTWTAGVPSNDPAGYIEIEVGGVARYVPFWT